MAPRFLSTLTGPKYATLPADQKWTSESLETETQPTEPTIIRRKETFWSLRNQSQIALALLLGILAGIFAPKLYTKAMHAYTAHQLGKYLDCGTTPQEAVARGCRFDLMGSAWHPPACFNADLHNEMLREGNWTWFNDTAHKHPVTEQFALGGDYDKLWPMRKDGRNTFHTAHCLYLWRKLHYAVLKRWPIDEDLYDYKHTKHCVGILLKLQEPEGTFSRVKPGYPTCRQFDYYNDKRDEDLIAAG